MALSELNAQAGLFQPGRTGLHLDDYDYPLREELIARFPLQRRDESRMLVLDRASGSLSHRQFFALPDLLQPGDLVVLNNTKVLPARFIGHRRGHTGQVEALLLHPSAEDDRVWTALMRPAKRLRPGTIIELPGSQSTLEVLGFAENGRGSGTVRVHLADEPDVPTLMQRAGQMPIPPYLNRKAVEADKETYQTVFSKIPGAQAAPTAGLHFTRDVLAQLAARGVQTTEVTLAVSAGTFRGVDVEDVTRHQMDPEYYTLPPETAEAIRQTKTRGGRVVAIGTTVAKTLESVAHKLNGELAADSDWSRLFIYPGFRFQVTDVLLTNFHLPKTTLLMLVSAFAGREKIAAAYAEAIAREYRFFSYGDCMLIL